MTEQAAADGLQVDTSRKYKLNAGACEVCGNSKTWEFKVPNFKRGKLMPGHVTGVGFNIGDGNCPKWAVIAGMSKQRAERKASGPEPAGKWIKDIAASDKPASKASGRLEHVQKSVAVTASPAPGGKGDAGSVVSFLASFVERRGDRRDTFHPRRHHQEPRLGGVTIP
jgi:hypothetical protein